MKDLKKLRDKIQNLEKIHQLYILQLFITHNVSYTENSNGIFINMKTIGDNVYNLVCEYLAYVKLQEDHLHQGEAAKELYKINLTKGNKDKAL